jgi:hypothetical protein
VVFLISFEFESCNFSVLYNAQFKVQLCSLLQCSVIMFYNDTCISHKSV